MHPGKKKSCISDTINFKSNFSEMIKNKKDEYLFSPLVAGLGVFLDQVEDATRELLLHSQQHLEYAGTCLAQFLNGNLHQL